MLTIREPLNLHSIEPVCSTVNPLSEKIRSNYDMFRAGFEEEELFHMVTQPPEIYLGEGGMTSLVQDTQIQHNQNIKMEMMNNLVNRVVLMNENEFTYQDTVYVENLLNKLGITDVQQFLKQICNLQEDTKQTNQLIDLYWNHFQTLQEIIGAVKEEQGASDKEKREIEQADGNFRPLKEIYYLHDSIFKRLQTGVIYEELKNYFSGIPGQDMLIQQKELLISEQARQAQHIILNKLQNLVRNENNPLFYHRYNLYEEGDSYPTTHSGEQGVNNLTSAILMNLLDNIYEIRYHNLNQKIDKWYDVSYALQYAANNTLKRYEEYRSNRSYQIKPNLEYTSYINEAKKNEYSTLKTILRIAQEDEREFDLETLVHIRQEGDSHLLRDEHSTQNIINEEYVQAENNNHMEQSDITVVKKLLNTSEQILESQQLGDVHLGNNQYLLQNEVNFSQENQMLVENQQVHQTENTNIQNQTQLEQQKEYQNIRQQLDVINQQNLEKLQQLQLQEISQPQNIQINLDKSRKDAFRALTDPEGVQMELRTQELETENIESYKESRVEKLMSRDTKEIYRLVEEYRKNPARAIAESIVKLPTQEQLQQEVSEAAHDFVQLEYLQEETIEQSVDRIIEKYNEPEEKLVQNITKMNDKIENMEFVHKQTENILSEDILEELQYQNQVLQKKTEVHKQEEDIQNTVITRNNISTNHIVEQTTQDVTGMLKDGLQKNINQISEQVYNRLEKKLVSERKRRGY